LRTARIRSRSRELERAVAERTDDLRRYARALEEHSRALDQANAARELYGGAGEPAVEDLKEVDAWLAAHALP